MNCVTEDYIRFVKNFLLDYYRMLLKEKYDRKLVLPLVEKYIDVRYYNKSIYSDSNSSLEKINKELKKLSKELIKMDMKKEELIKKIFTLFGYILYIDDCTICDSIRTLVKTLLNTEELQLNLSEEEKEEFTNLVVNFTKTKKAFFKTFENKDFTLSTKRLAKNIYNADLKQDCKINLYSEAAINRAYSAGVVLENRQYLLLLMLSGEILREVNELNFNNVFVIDFPDSLFDKEKKINKYLNAIDNELLKSKISLRVTYSAFLENRKRVNSFINKGYNVSVLLGDDFDEEIGNLVLFSYVFVYEKYDYYDIIMENKDVIMSRIITL